MTDQEKIEFLKKKLQESESQLIDFENDVRTTISFVTNVAKNLGININDLENLNIGSVLPGIIMKASTGMIDASMFNSAEMKVIFERYKHLYDGNN